MRWFVSFLVILTLCACGGGGGGGGGGAADVGSTATAAANASVSAGTLTGVAAVGAGISGRVYMLDASGHDRYVDTVDGHFSFDLGGMQSPVLLKAQWSDASGIRHLYSFASAEGVVNITPLTHFAVTTAAGSVSLDTLYGSPSASGFAALQSAMPAAIARLQSYLQPMLAQYGVPNANPISFRFAPDHTGMDALLDNIQITYTGDNVILADKGTGAMLVAAPVANLAAAVTSANWNATDAARAADMDVAINAKGVGLVLWSERVNAHYVLKARLSNGTDPGQTLTSTGDASAPRVAVDNSGNAVAVWAELDNQRNAIWASRYNASANQWASPRMLSIAGAVANAGQPELALDQAGNAIVVWLQGDGRSKHADGWAVQYLVDKDSWSVASMVTDGVNNIAEMQVAINAAGRGQLAWAQERGDGSAAVSQPADIWARNVLVGGAWGQGSIVNTNGGKVTTAYVYGQLALSVNAAGDAALLWSERLLPSLPMAVEAAMYKAATGWQAASTITLDSAEDSANPEVALDDAGNALAVWQQQTAYGAYGGSNRYTAGVGWGTAGHFVDSKLGDALPPSLAMDAAGNATVVWYRWSAGNAIDLMVNRYQKASGWAAASVFAPLGTDSTMARSAPCVAANALGQTLVVWGAKLNAVASWL